MNNVFKKAIVILSVLLFFMLSISSIYAMNTDNHSIILEESKQKTMTIYRISPEGLITPIEVNITEETEDIAKYLESKCSELFKEDVEMQTLVQNLQKKYGEDKNVQEKVGLINIYSRGKGFHIKTKLGLNFFNSRFIMLRVILATFLISPKKGLVIGIYNDEEAYTTFNPIGDTTSITNITGKHIIIAGGFFGYTTWVGRFSLLHGLNEFSRIRLNHSFRGICTLVFYTQF